MSHISTNNDHKAAHRIAVISDTHNLLRPEVAEVIKTCDVVLHGGDISGPETLEKIRLACAKSASSMAGGAASERVGGTGNFYVVRGNNDRDWAADIPYKLEVVIYGRKFFMTHKKRDIPEDVDADVVIYGHSHRYAQDYFDGTLYLNPGSCGPRRFNQAITMAVLTIPDLETGSSEGGGSKVTAGRGPDTTFRRKTCAADISGMMTRKTRLRKIFPSLRAKSINCARGTTRQPCRRWL